MKNLTLLSLFKIAIKHIFILILVGVIFAVGAFSYCSFIATPKYTATGSVLATNGAIISNETSSNGTINNSDIVASINLVDTVVDILETPTIFMQLSEKISKENTYKNLQSRCNISRTDNNSMFVYVSFSASTPEEALTLVNSYLELTPEYINNYVSNSATVVVTPADDARKVFPSTLTYTMLAAILGVAITFAILVVIHSLNTVIEDCEGFEEHFDVPVLGVVPNFTNARTDKAYRIYDDLSKGGKKNGN